MYEILNNQEIEKICHLLECDQAELKNLFDDSKKINESSKTVYQKIMKILLSAKLIYQTKIVLMTYKDQILIVLST